MDLVFLFSVSVGPPSQLPAESATFDILPQTGNSSVVNGLFNEVMSSALARVTDTPVFLDETLLFTMVAEKRIKLKWNDVAYNAPFIFKA